MKNLNPYARALSLLFRRIKWDLRPESWGARKKLNLIQNSRLGEKAVILCNGPSLLNVNFDLLKDIYTFGLNKINLSFETTDFRPSCVVAVNGHVIEQNQEFYRSSKIPIFLDAECSCRLKIFGDEIYHLHSADCFGFAEDVSFSIYQGFTVTFVALQLAYHFGFSDVALVGCDHYYDCDMPANTEVVSGNVDISHFNSLYFSGGQIWQAPDLLQSEVSYDLARRIYEGSGRRLYDATVGGRLNILPKIDLEAFLNA